MPLLERLTIPRDDRAATLEQLKHELNLVELIYVSTCNRVEFIYTVNDHHAGEQVLHKLIDFFFRGGRDINFFPNDFVHFTGKEAILHLFRTTSALESLVVGETQITGQVKQAHQEAVELGLCGPVLDRLIREALVVAKKVRRETSLGQGCLSMASLAMIELKANLPKDFRPTVALVGSGPMTTKFAKHIRESFEADLLFVSRSIDNAEKLAVEHSGSATSLSDFLTARNPVDVIISATASNDPVFDGAFLERLEPAQGRVICIDLAIPRDFSSEFDSSDKALVMDIKHLKSREQGNLRQKFVEAGQANRIVREAVGKFLSDQIELTLKPIFNESYQESIEMANRAMEDLFAKRVTSLSDEDRDAVLRLVSKLVGHSSFQPVRMLSERLVTLQSELAISEFAGPQREAV
jgi:glutamyl-tRNA reductase